MDYFFYKDVLGGYLFLSYFLYVLTIVVRCCSIHLYKKDIFFLKTKINKL